MTSRRSFLAAAGILGLGALAGCTTYDPTILGRTASPGPASQPPIPFQDEGLAELTQIEARARSLVGAGGSVTPTQAAMVEWIGLSVRTQHAALLRASPVPDATASPQEMPSVTPMAGTWDEFVTGIATFADDSTRRARECEGNDTLMWASMAGWARAVADHPSGSIPMSTATNPARAVSLAQTRALHDVVAQSHVLVFATELALVPLTRSDPAYGRIESAMNAWLTRRDRASELLRSLGGAVPGSQEPYDIAAPTTAGAALALVADVETRFLPTAGVWAGSADSTRSEAVELLVAATSDATGHGGPRQIWPGWPAAR